MWRGMDVDSSRRRFLELAGTGTALSIAGCSGLGGGGEETTADPLNGTDGTGDPDVTDGTPAQTAGEETSVGVALSGDQEKLQEEQQKIQSELQSGNLSREEAAAQYQEVQKRLQSEAMAAFQGRVESTDGLSLDDSLEQFGITLVTGTPATLLGTLEFEEVSAIVSESRFQQAKAQAEQGTDSG
jgi:hypothetical protein